jgi:RNA polymerase sigma-70 factor (ECF subfamily)
VLGLVRDPMLRDDVVAEVFLQAWRRLPTLRQPERFDAWLLRIAHHRAVNELRRQRRSARGGPRGVLEIADPDRMVAPHARLELLSDARTVREALLQLPEAQREALVLHHLAGFGYEEVARQLGRTNAGVRQLCHRALLRLRAALEDR